MDRPLVIRTCRTSKRLAGLLVLGVVVELVAIVLYGLSLAGALEGDWLLPLLIGLGIGTLLQVLFVVCYMRGTAFVFDGNRKTVTERLGGGKSRAVGTFADFKGVDLVARVREEALRGSGLEDIHKTYPDRNLMAYEICLVADGRDPVPVLRVGTKTAARTLQERIVKYCKWSYVGSSVPDSRRELPRIP